MHSLFVSSNMFIQSHTQNRTTNIFGLYLVRTLQNNWPQITKIYQTKPNTHYLTHLTRRLIYIYIYITVYENSYIKKNSYMLVVNKIQYQRKSKNHQIYKIIHTTPQTAATNVGSRASNPGRRVILFRRWLKSSCWGGPWSTHRGRRWAIAFDINL